MPFSTLFVVIWQNLFWQKAYSIFANTFHHFDHKFCFGEVLFDPLRAITSFIAWSKSWNARLHFPLNKQTHRYCVIITLVINGMTEFFSMERKMYASTLLPCFYCRVIKWSNSIIVSNENGLMTLIKGNFLLNKEHGKGLFIIHRQIVFYTLSKNE